MERLGGIIAVCRKGSRSSRSMPVAIWATSSKKMACKKPTTDNPQEGAPDGGEREERRRQRVQRELLSVGLGWLLSLISVLGLCLLGRRRR